MAKKTKEEAELIKSLDFDTKNAEALVEMLLDRQTSESTRISIINELTESQKSESFFETMYNELMSFGECPNCQHTDHWLVPFDVLSQMGYVVHKEDPRVPQHTDIKSCEEFSEACKKKKTHC